MVAAKNWEDLVEVTGFCWLWRGRIDKDGYGHLGDRLAHRLVYEALVGPIPKGLVIDHLCRIRNCVNPDHLEPVTVAENNRRGFAPLPPLTTRLDTCRKGHVFAKTGVVIQGGRRRCKECQDEYQRRYRASGKKHPK